MLNQPLFLGTSHLIMMYFPFYILLDLIATVLLRIFIHFNPCYTHQSIEHWFEWSKSSTNMLNKWMNDWMNERVWPAEKGGFLSNSMFQGTEHELSLYQPLTSCVALGKSIVLVHKKGTKTTGLPNIVSIQQDNIHERPWKNSNQKAVLLLTRGWGSQFLCLAQP